MKQPFRWIDDSIATDNRGSDVIIIIIIPFVLSFPARKKKMGGIFFYAEPKIFQLIFGTFIGSNRYLFLFTVLWRSFSKCLNDRAYSQIIVSNWMYKIKRKYKNGKFNYFGSCSFCAIVLCFPFLDVDDERTTSSLYSAYGRSRKIYIIKDGSDSKL